MATFDDYVIRISERGAKETANAIGVVGKESERATGFVAGLNRTLFALGSAFSVKSILEYTSTWQAMTNTLKIVTKDAAELTAVQDRLFKQAQSNRTSVEALTDLYQKLRLSQKEVGVSGENLFKVTDIVSKAMTVAGKSGQAATNGLRQFVQGLVSGKIQGEELRSVLENTPYLAKTLADGLMVPVGALRELGAEGKLTSRTVVEALMRMEQAVNRDFGKTSVTITQAITVLENAFLRFVGQSGEVSTASSVIANGILLIASNIDKLALGLAVAAGAWVTYRIAVASVAAAQLVANAAINANPIVRIATIIGSVIAGFVLLTGSTEKWVSALKSAGETVVSTFKWVSEGVTSAITLFSQWGSSVTEIFTGLSTTVEEWVNSFVNFFEELPGKVNRIWVSIKEAIKKAFQEALEWVQAQFSAFADWLGSTWIGKALTMVDKLAKALREVSDFAMKVSGGDWSGNSGTKISGARADGGSVMKGKTYLVGENGPELWTANQSGYIIPNGGSGGSSFSVANDNQTAVSIVADGFREAVGEQFTELLDTTKSNHNLLEQIATNTKQLSEQVRQNSQAAQASKTGTGTSAINNFDGISYGGDSSQVNRGSTSTGGYLAADYAPTGGSGGTGMTPGGVYGDTGGGIETYTPAIRARWIKDYINSWNNGISWSDSTNKAAYYLQMNVPSAVQGWVKENAQMQGYKMKTYQTGATIQFRSGGQFEVPGFAKGGSFQVPGSTGVDSKLVNMRVSPGEQVDIRTRKQVREERETWGSGGNSTNVTFNIKTPDADSFRRSKKQVNRDLMRALMKDAS